MTPDEGEMFFPEYWNFHLNPSGLSSDVILDRRISTRSKLDLEEVGDEHEDWTNATILPPIQAPTRDRQTISITSSAPLVPYSLHQSGTFNAPAEHLLAQGSIDPTAAAQGKQHAKLLQTAGQET
ncbi:MAG: hypothetical protein Q9217_000386 [Psora testacea]